MTDAANNFIGGCIDLTASDAEPLYVESVLQDPLKLTPEEKNDYIQFNLGDQVWPSNKKGGPAVPECSIVDNWRKNRGYKVRLL